MNKLKFIGISFLLLIMNGCATIGNDFPVSEVAKIKIGQTTQIEIEKKFGSPWRVGLEDGIHTWTYGLYHYSAFDNATTKDLLIKFDDHNIVKSYTFNSTNGNDVK